MGSNVKIGDLVWAKVRGFPYWPARVDEPPTNTKRPGKKDAQWVFFFGSCDNGWAEVGCIKPYKGDTKEMHLQAKNAKKFKVAVKHINTYIEKMKLPDFNEARESFAVPKESASSTHSTPNQQSKRASTSNNTSDGPSKRPRLDDTEENGLSTEEQNDRAQSADLSTSLIMADDEEASTPIKEVVKKDKVPKKRASKKPSVHADEDSLIEESIGAVGGDSADPSKYRFGFLGVGNMGSAMLKNLIKSSHNLFIWNRSPEKSEAIKEYADNLGCGSVTICEAPFVVLHSSDIIFSCLGDPKSAQEIVFGNCGVVHMAEALDGKGYVEMTGLDPETSSRIDNVIRKLGGRYMEAQIQGSKSEAEQGNLLVLCAGDRTLFHDCEMPLKAIGKTALYLGTTGYATRVNLILQLIKGIALAGLVEGLALADRSGISANYLLKIFKLTTNSNPYLVNKAEMIIKKDFTNVEQALEHMQKDIKLAVKLSDDIKQPLLMGATANEVYKHARRLGYDGRDAACIYLRTRH